MNWFRALMATLGMAMLIGSAGGSAEAQGPAMARIEVPNVAPWYEFVAHSVTGTGRIGAEVATLERSEAEQPLVAEVPPGCYVVVVTRTGGPGGDWEDPVSGQPAFCLVAGETKVFETGGTLPTSSGRFVMNGEVRDPDGNFVSGATIDFFEPPTGLDPNQIRLLDHRLADYRGSFDLSLVSGARNWVYASILKLCRIQTLTAPEGYTWAGGRRYVNRSACGSDFTVAVAYPDPGPSPADGFIEIEVPAYEGVGRLTGTIGFADDSPLPVRLQWFRASEYPYQARFAVPPGCHEIEFGLAAGDRIFTESGRATQQVTACVDSGQTEAVSPRGEVREVSYDPAQPYLVGSFVDAAGGPVEGVQVDLFYGRSGLSDDDLRTVDHAAGDYRGPFYASTASGPDGRFLLPIFQTCYVATLVAPDGYSFDGSRYFQQTTCQGDDQIPVVLSADGGPGGFDGRIVTESGAPVADVVIDVFAPVEGVSDDELRSADHVTTDYRGQYTQTATTGVDGRFTFDAAARCWVLTYIGDDQVIFPTGQYFRSTICAGDSPVVVVPDVDQPEPSTIRGTVSGGAEVTVDLFSAQGDGSRGSWLGDTVSSGGAYRFEVAAGCYVSVLIAPDGSRFAASGTRYQEMAGCVDEGASLDNPTGELLMP